MLTDKQLLSLIKSGKVTIEPFAPSNLMAGKYDVHLGPTILIPKKTTKIIDPEDPKKYPEYQKINISKKPFVIKPGEFVLGQTAELIGLSAEVGMFLDGRTTLARLGLTVHLASNFIPPGQDPHIITLEIFNASPWKIQLTNNMRVGKIVAFQYSDKNTISAKDFNQYNGQKEAMGATFRKKKA